MYNQVDPPARWLWISGCLHGHHLQELHFSCKYKAASVSLLVDEISGHFDDEIKQDVFKAKTTYTNDFRIYPSVKREIRCWPRDRKEKPTKPSAPQIITDSETYMPWKKGVHIPFNLLLEPKPIIGTNPYVKFEKPVVPPDLQKEEAIRTRPRLYMAPAVSMDDVPDPEMRQLLLQHMYTTDWRKAAAEAAMSVTEKATPNTTIENGDLVTLQVDLMKSLPEQWRKLGKAWDKKQLRATVDPTTTFWINKDPPVQCGACVNPLENLVSEEKKKEISNLLKEDKLRMAHDMSVPGYAGYKPRLSKGVTLAKTDLPVTHPFVSVTQAITKRYEKED